MLTRAQRRQVYRYYRLGRAGCDRRRWCYEPRDFTNPFELYSELYPTRRGTRCRAP